MSKNKITVGQKIMTTFKGREGSTFKRQEISDMVLSNYPGTNKTSVLPSDYCYNRINNGISFGLHLFEYVSRGVYKYLGENVKYNGVVYWKDTEFGVWKNGTFKKLGS